MSRQATYATAVSSYFQLGSMILAGLLSIPLALRYLSSEQIGLWTFTSQSLGYLLLLDFGVTSALGRLMADPIHRNDKYELQRWFSLVTVVLCCQGFAIWFLGRFAIDSILGYFEIPPDLMPEAQKLWLLMLWLNAISFPFRINNAILFVQNRSYWTNIGATAGSWIGLATFWYFLHLDYASLAYGYSALATLILSVGVPWCAVCCGFHRFSFSLRAIRFQDLRELMAYSSGTFAINIAVQVVFVSQSMILTKILGLGSVAAYSVSTRIALLGMQVIWRTFDAMLPRWQQLYIKGDMEILIASFRKHLSLSLGLACTIAIGLYAFNRLVVFYWAKPDLYLGRLFDVVLGFFILQSTLSHCLAFLFTLGKRLRRWAICAVVEAMMNVTLAILLTKQFGAIGVIVAGVSAGMIGMINAMLDGTKTLTKDVYQFYRSLGKAPSVMILAMTAAALSILGVSVDQTQKVILVECAIAVAGSILFLFLYREILMTEMRRLVNGR